jgi:hypothetical protein
MMTHTLHTHDKLIYKNSLNQWTEHGANHDGSLYQEILQLVAALITSNSL